MFDLKCSSRALDHFSFLSGVFKYSVGFLKTWDKILTVIGLWSEIVGSKGPAVKFTIFWRNSELEIQ
jgi:hypothetical protein